MKQPRKGRRPMTLARSLELAAQRRASYTWSTTTKPVEDRVEEVLKKASRTSGAVGIFRPKQEK